jgi:hypothetical protein
MLAIGSSYGVAGGSALAYAQPEKTAARQSGASSGDSGASSDSSGLTLTRHDLLELNGAVGQSSQVSNALATAHDALDVIGGLLGNVGAVLAAARSPGDTSFDPVTDQDRIDSAVVTIDAVASSARFGGRNLLDGRFEAKAGGGSIQLASFASADLGAGTQPVARGQSMMSLMTGGANDLASGQIETASQILTAAMTQVNDTQGKIITATGSADETSPVELPALPAGITPTELVSSAATQLLADPGLSAVAVANSDRKNVLALLQG